MSADTIVPGYTNPQNLNRYSYVTNNPLRYTDPTGHMQASEQYKDSDNKCDAGDKACNQMKAKIKKKQNNKNQGNTSFATVTPAPTSASVPSFITLPTQQCTSDHPCIGNFIPSVTPTATSTPYNALATAGANLDIAANTAVVGAWNYCTGDPEPPCGQTAEKALPGLAPIGTVFDAGVGTKHIIDDSSSRPPTQLEIIGSDVVFAVSIPTTVIPLLIFLFIP